MATAAEWLEGARLRTLPAAVAPVLAGSAVAVDLGGFNAGRALLALLVALALQVGVNYANDYSDGVRGTDSAEKRVGPMRLVGSGAATPGQVRAAAFGCFAVAAAAGLGLVVLTGAWWLIAVGAACIVAAWFYTGGSRPYGYLGLGEVFVFVFFGLVATCGTTYVQLLRVPPSSVWAGVSMGALACAILVVNNLRDIDGDVASGKRTLAVRLGADGTRGLYLGLVLVSMGALLVTALLTSPEAIFALAAWALLSGPVRTVLGGAVGLALIPVLKWTGLAQLLAGVLLFVGSWFGR